MILDSPARGATERSDTPSLVQVMLRRKLSIGIPTVVLAAGAWVAAAELPPQYVATAVLALDARKIQVIEINSVVSPLSGENAALRSELDSIASRSMAELLADNLDLWNNQAVLRALYSPTSVSQLVRAKLAEAALVLGEHAGPYWTMLPAWHASVDAPEANAIADGRLDGRMVADLAEPVLPAAIPSPGQLGEHGLTRADIVDWLLGGLDVSNDGRSLTIYVSFTSPDPELSALVSNAYVEAYLNDQVGLKVRATQRASRWLETRLVELRDDLEQSESAISRFRREADLLEVNGAILAGQRVTEMSSQLSLAKGERARIEATAGAARAALRGGGTGGGAAEMLNSPEAAGLRAALSQVDAQLAELRGRGALRHPRTIALEAQRESLARQLAAENERIVRNLESEAAAARSQEAQLASSLRTLESRLGQGGQETVQLNQLLREAEANRDIYESFLARYKETIEQEGLAAADARILSRAEIPRVPSGPSAVPMVFLGMISGLGLGGLLAALRERLDTRLYRISDIEALAAVPVMGVLPSLRPWQSPETHVLRNRPSDFGEALQRAHTTFALSRSPSLNKAIAVTSAVQGDGKTTFALAWARYLARNGARVLVIDADLHRPRMASLLRVTPKAGTVEVLRGSVSLDDAIVVDERSGAHLLSAGGGRGDASLLVRPTQVKNLIAEAKARYDYVIIDTPPVTAVPDAAMVAANADSVLFLVRWRRTPRRALVAAFRFLRLCGIEIEGVVLTSARVGRESYSQGRYSSTGGLAPTVYSPSAAPAGRRHEPLAESRIEDAAFGRAD